MLLENSSFGFFSKPHGLLRQRPATWLRVEGPDATEFLQGQCTQDLRSLRPGQAGWALWLSIKGKVLAETLVLCENAPDGARMWRLWSAQGDGETLRARLDASLIADDVTLTDEVGANAQPNDWEQVTLAGPEAEAWLKRETPAEASLPLAGEWRNFGGGYLFPGRRGQADIWEWLHPQGEANTASQLSLAQLPLLSAEALERSRLWAGVAAIPGEFGPADLPQEAGMEAFAISFTKGCYLGQEVMARLHAMGQVRRRLLRVGGRGPAPAVGVHLFGAGENKRLGELRAAVDDGQGGWLGLAMIQLLGLDLSRPVHLAPEGDLSEGRTVFLVDSSFNETGARSLS